MVPAAGLDRLFLLSVLATVGLARVCPSMDIRNSASQLSLLEDCHRIQGFLQVVLIETSKEADFANFTFPNLREVTSYVIFYRVHGLTSIGRLFPNLSVIGGDVLVRDYALIVSQMTDLKEIDLTNLRVILRGAVAVVKNPKLCYVDTVDWDLIANSGENWISPSKENSLCPGCVCPPHNRCWSRNHCQELEWGTNCHPECFGGCNGTAADECFTCKHFMYVKECVPHCPPNTYVFEKRQCVTANECLNMNETLLRPTYNKSDESWFIWENYCVSSCPQGLERDPVLGCKQCVGKCVLVCDGASVDSIQKAQTLKDCTYINGSLELQIKSGNQSVIMKELDESLGDIEEISGYLKVTRSFPLTSLNFLKNLRIIHGFPDYIKPMNYSLIVIENQNLQSLWDWDNRPAKRNLSILSGRIFFHYNPNLCLKHIMEMANITNQQNITNLEVATESNGNKFACHTIDIQVSVQARYSTEVSILISWPSNERSSKYNVMRYRYMIYYIKAPFKNLTATYETSECGDYRWTVNDVSAKTLSNGTVYYILNKLEPNTQYAFFVKTYTIDSTGGQSPINYFKTLSSKPSWPTELRGVSNSSYSITLFWSHPDKPNGHINEYVVTGFMREEEEEMLMYSDFCSSLRREMILKKKLQTTTVIPEFMTKIIKEDKKDCCKRGSSGSSDNYVVSNDNTLLCQNLNPNEAKLPPMLLSSIKASTCEKYMYNLIESSVIDSPPSVKKRFIDDKKKFINDIQLYRKDIFQFPFRKNFSGNVTTATFNNLEPYALYTFEVKACREVDPFEKLYPEYDALREDERCSISSIVTVRTLPTKSGDAISRLTVDISNRSVELKWQIPVSPNLMIVSYDVEHIRTDIPNYRPVIECIKAVDYHNKGSYIISGLPLGKYSFRVRAISLAGIGPFSSPVTASITEFSSKTIIFASVLITFFLLVIAFFAVFILHYRKKLMLQQNVLIASVNPEYFGIPTIDEEWELPRERVQIIKELKRGNFGIVCEGLLLPEEKVVAVKKVVETGNERDCVEFLNEACVMKQFTSAYHIVRLIGIVSKDWPQLVVMEMMERGDLKSYLRSCRDVSPPTPPQMLLMAAQIADGMAFLEASKFVHRDLAARNCMVRADLVVKIGDFGMTRDIFESDYYRKGNKGLLPIRWMSPESLNDGVFTSKSDVWSYGIVLWEMATLASQPYQGLSNEQVLAFVVSGNKLDLPPVYPKPFKTIMHWCWKWKPKFRPSFIQILDELTEYTTKGFREVSYYDSPEGRAARETLAAQPEHCLLEPSTNSVKYHSN